MDAVEVAGRFGIDRNRAVTYENDSVGNRVKYEAITDVVTCVRESKVGSVGMALDECSGLKKVKADYMRRHRK